MNDIEYYLSETTSNPSFMIVISFMLGLFIMFYILKTWPLRFIFGFVSGTGVFTWLWFFDPNGIGAQYFLDIYYFSEEWVLDIYTEYL